MENISKKGRVYPIFFLNSIKYCFEGPEASKSVIKKKYIAMEGIKSVIKKNI